MSNAYLVHISIVVVTASFNTPPKTLQRKLPRAKQSLLSEKQPFLVHIRSRLCWTKEAVLRLSIADRVYGGNY